MVSKSKKNLRKLKKLKLIVMTLFFISITIYFSKKLNYALILRTSNTSEKIYNCVKTRENRINAYNRAIFLNGGTSANTCVYFVAEVLRMNNVKINENICNTSDLLSIMKKKGFKIGKDYKKLKPGDICFTTDSTLNKEGTPTHVYIFMGWQKDGQYEYAYICDNQAKDYKGKIYHLRNITKVENINGYLKEPFSFFMYK